MRDPLDEKVRYECSVCCYAVSAGWASPSVEDKLDRHEERNPNHKMKEVRDDG